MFECRIFFKNPLFREKIRKNMWKQGKEITVELVIIAVSIRGLVPDIANYRLRIRKGNKNMVKWR